MKSFAVAGLLVLVLATVLCGCSSTGAAPETAVAAPEDRQIEKDVLNRLLRDPVTGGSTFGISVQAGVVTLQGSVASETVRVRALSIVRGAPNVKDVVDRLYRRENPQRPMP